MTSTSFVHSDVSHGPLGFTLQDVWLSVSDWSCHCGCFYLSHEDLFCIALLCILATSLKFSASVRSIQFLSFIVPIFAWNVLLVSLIFLEEISSHLHSIVSLYFFALFTEECFLRSPFYFGELCIQMGTSFLFSFAFCFFYFLSYF